MNSPLPPPPWHIAESRAGLNNLHALVARLGRSPGSLTTYRLGDALRSRAELESVGAPLAQTAIILSVARTHGGQSLVATPPDAAAECAAAMIRPAVGYHGARYDPHAEVFQRLSRAEITDTGPIGTIEAVYRERNGTWRYKARCAHCGSTHMNGGGAGPVPFFGHRAADCGAGGGYALVAVEAAHV